MKQVACVVLLALLALHALHVQGKSYDFVIVGGGTAGCVVAGRLSENPQVKVLVLERGSDESTNPTVVVSSMNSAFGNLLAAHLPLEVQLNVEINSGRVFMNDYVSEAYGGGPQVSGVFWTRNDPLNQDEWCQSLGATGYCHSDLLPYYKKSENFTSLYGLGPVDSSRGTSGPLPLGDLDLNDPNLANLLNSASSTLELDQINDLNTNSGLKGISVAQRMLGHDVNNPSRQTTCRKYVDEHLANRPNLEVVLQATVKRVEIRQGKVKFVEYATPEDCRSVRVKKEAIISAGAWNTPKILRNSGVGPASELQALGITVNKDLAGVGSSMENHLYVTTSYTEVYPQNNYPYAFGNSPLLMAFDNLTSPFIDTEYTLGYSPTFNPAVGVVSTSVITTRNSATGFSQLRSANPFDRPFTSIGIQPATAYPNLIAGIRKMRTLMLQDYPALTGRFVSETSPGLAVLPLAASDAEYAAYVQREIQSYNHVSGGSKIGPSTDPSSVVDTDLRVHGVDGLRIVDTSVFARDSASHPHALVIAIAEKVSDAIKAQYGI